MLVAIGISHKTAAIDIRERLSFSPEKIGSALKQLVAQTGLTEAVLLSTCNRTEIYGGMQQTPIRSSALLEWWRAYHPKGSAKLIAPVYYQLSNEKVVTHLMRLASGLDSLALGEAQILGQLKQAYHHSKDLGLLGEALGQTFEASFSVAKKVRTHTEVARHPTSIACLAITLAKRIFTDLSKTRILLIGAGENIKHIIAHLKSQHVHQIDIINRTYEKACHLAKQSHLQAHPMSQLKQQIAKADIVITSTGSDTPIINQPHIEEAIKGQRHRPRLLIDLGVPRDIQPCVSEFDDVYLYTVDDLQAIASDNLNTKELAAKEAERIIAYEACAFIAKLHARHKMHSVVALREQAEQYKCRAIQLAAHHLEQGADPKEVVEQLAYKLTNQLIHEPTVRMKEAIINQDELMISIYKEMFGIK